VKPQWILFLLLVIAVGFIPSSCQPTGPQVASKAFTESVVLGELVKVLAESNDAQVDHQRQLGGTPLVFGKLKTRQIDVYPDYTGTISNETFKKPELDTLEKIRAELEPLGIAMSDPLGFTNGYALAMKKSVAEERGIETISDLREHSDLTYRFSNEFMKRTRDGWPALREAYQLRPQSVEGISHELAYRQIDNGTIHVMDIYETDAKIKTYDLTLLEDDKDFFPEYEAVYLYRADLESTDPKVYRAIKRLEGSISQEEMRNLNAAVDEQGKGEAVAAADFLAEKFDVEYEVEVETLTDRLLKTTREHLDLVRMSLVSAILVAIPLGVIAARRAVLGQGILGAVGIVQTIPALALLVLLIPVETVVRGFSPGFVPAVISLFMYSLLPIVRNTYTAIKSIPGPVRESAEALGLSDWARLVKIELPMASPTILAGIKTAAVINVGFATLGGLIGTGGYGQPIMTGIRLNNFGYILEGAIPAAALAMVVQGLFELAERLFVPRGLRLKKQT